MFIFIVFFIASSHKPRSIAGKLDKSPNIVIDELEAEDVHLSPATSRDDEHFFEDNRKNSVCSLKLRSQELSSFEPTEIVRNEHYRHGRGKNSSPCGNFDDSFSSRSRSNEYMPVFIDDAAIYPNTYHYRREIRGALKHERCLSPTFADNCFKKSNFSHFGESNHHSTFYETNHSPTHQKYSRSKFYLSGCKCSGCEPFKHDSLSPGVPSVEERQHAHEIQSPLQDEVPISTFGEECRSIQYPLRSSPTSKGPPGSSKPKRSNSPLSRISSSKPFCPGLPFPMCLPTSSSTCDGYRASLFSLSFRNPCFQRFPYYFPPSHLAPIYPDEKHSVISNGGLVGSRSDVYGYKNSMYIAKKPIKGHMQETSSTNSEFEESNNLESPRSNQPPTIDIQVGDKLAQIMASTSTVPVDELVGSQGHNSIENAETLDENENILNEADSISDDGELAKVKSPKGRKFTCKFCGKIYISLGALKMHIRTHTLPCKCHICGKAFSRPWLLQGHIRTHTGEKPYKCHMCQRAFADRSNLRAHLQTHSDVKKYRCRTCHKTFSRMSLLLKHEEAGCLAS